VAVRGSQGARARTSRRLAAAAAGLVVAATLGACSGTPGAAAVVDGTVIRSADLGVALGELAPFFQGVTTGNILTALIDEPTLTAVAAEQGVGVSDEQAAATLDSAVQSVTPGAEVEFGPASLAVGRYLAASAALSAQPDAEAISADIQERIAALDVEVNPRFGTVDEANTVVDPVPAPWVVTPTE